MRSMTRTASTGWWPIAVSSESITASVPSKIALATSVTSARVGRREGTIEASIWGAAVEVVGVDRRQTGVGARKVQSLMRGKRTAHLDLGVDRIVERRDDAQLDRTIGEVDPIVGLQCARDPRPGDGNRPVVALRCLCGQQ